MCDSFVFIILVSVSVFRRFDPLTLATYTIKQTLQIQHQGVVIVTLFVNRKH